MKIARNGLLALTALLAAAACSASQDPDEASTDVTQASHESNAPGLQLVARYDSVAKVFSLHELSKKHSRALPLEPGEVAVVVGDGFTADLDTPAVGEVGIERGDVLDLKARARDGALRDLGQIVVFNWDGEDLEPPAGEEATGYSGCYNYSTSCNQNCYSACTYCPNYSWIGKIKYKAICVYGSWYCTNTNCLSNSTSCWTKGC